MGRRRGRCSTGSSDTASRSFRSRGSRAVRLCSSIYQMPGTKLGLTRVCDDLAVVVQRSIAPAPQLLRVEPGHATQAVSLCLRRGTLHVGQLAVAGILTEEREVQRVLGGKLRYVFDG